MRLLWQRPMPLATVEHIDRRRNRLRCSWRLRRKLAEPVQAEHISMWMQHLLLLAHDGDSLPVGSQRLRVRCALAAVCCRRVRVWDVSARAVGGRRRLLSLSAARIPAETAHIKKQ
jgi:hypothetical protein